MLTTRNFALRCVPLTNRPDCPFLPHVRHRYMENGLQLNPDKSEAHQLRTVSLRHQFVTVADVDLPLANEMKVFGVILDRHLTFEKHVSAVARSCNYHYHNQAICHIHHLLTTQLAQTLAYSLILSGSTTATLCSMAFHPATSRSYSMFKTVQHGSFSRRQGDLAPSHYYASCTGWRFNIESRTSWRY